MCIQSLVCKRPGFSCEGVGCDLERSSRGETEAGEMVKPQEDVPVK